MKFFNAIFFFGGYNEVIVILGHQGAANRREILASKNILGKVSKKNGRTPLTRVVTEALGFPASIKLAEKYFQRFLNSGPVGLRLSAFPGIFISPRPPIAASLWFGKS